MAHVRRKFIEALPGGKEKGVFGQAVRLIRALYKIEQDLKEENAGVNRIYHIRQTHAKPILEKIKDHLEKK